MSFFWQGLDDRKKKKNMNNSCSYYLLTIFYQELTCSLMHSLLFCIDEHMTHVYIYMHLCTHTYTFIHTNSFDLHNLMSQVLLSLSFYIEAAETYRRFKFRNPDIHVFSDQFNRGLSNQQSWAPLGGCELSVFGSIQVQDV